MVEQSCFWQSLSENDKLRAETIELCELWNKCEFMTNYEKSKTPRRVAAVVYLVFMAFILGGTYLSQHGF